MNFLFKISIKKTIFLTLFVLPHYLLPAAASDAIAQTADQPIPAQTTNGLLIFLDDTELTGKEGSAAIMYAFAAALLEKASPLLVSASLIAQLYQAPQYGEGGDKRLQEITKLPLDQWTDKEFQDLEKITCELVGFKVTADEWIIKEVNPSLYLLLHNTYLQEKKVSVEAITEFQEHSPLTPIELQLGLKVQHLKTVKAVNIKRPLPEPNYADYFLEAAWDKKKSTSTLFVTNSDYHKAKSTPLKPAWAFFIVGHGLMNTSLAGMRIEQFKDFLTFLQHKITTKLLYYSTCFGAGDTHEKLYKDTETGISPSYSFAIMTQALTDVPVISYALDYLEDHGSLLLKEQTDFKGFLRLATTSDCINYQELATCITQDLAKVGLNNIPQIKLPGLPWFSVADESKVVAIGSVLASTRNHPLSIQGASLDTPTAKKGPLAILLYTHNIPFELITTGEGLYPDTPPAIISMIPASAFHTLKKISSPTESVDNLLGNFLKLHKLQAPKVFVISQLEGMFSKKIYKCLPAARRRHEGLNAIDSLSWVIIVLSPNEPNESLYFCYNGGFYKAKNLFLNEKSVTHASDTEIEQCKEWIQRSIVQQPSFQERISDLPTKLSSQLKDTLITKTSILSEHNSSALKSLPPSKVEKQSTHEYLTREAMKALSLALTNKKKRKAWLRKLGDKIKSDAEWIKINAQWIKKEAEQLATEVIK